MAGIAGAAAAVLFLLYGSHEVGAWIALGFAAIFGVRAVIEQRHTRGG
jgi:hypothetical protein